MSAHTNYPVKAANHAAGIRAMLDGKELKTNQGNYYYNVDSEGFYNYHDDPVDVNDRDFNGYEIVDPKPELKVNPLIGKVVIRKSTGVQYLIVAYLPAVDTYRLEGNGACTISELKEMYYIQGEDF